jgi:hypothetical protein
MQDLWKQPLESCEGAMITLVILAALLVHMGMITAITGSVLALASIILAPRKGSLPERVTYAELVAMGEKIRRLQ